MIEYICGSVTELTPTQIVLETNGVGYALLVSLNTYSATQGKKVMKLFAYEAIREDSHLLFGFATREERELFLHLIGVSGIGGQTARMILSAFTAAELAEIIRSEDARSLKSVKGIGPKAAQRIIIDLKDKMKSTYPSEDGGSSVSSTNIPTSAQREIVDEAVQALSVLGFAPASTQKAVMEIIKQHPDASVEIIIKLALKML